MRRPDWVSRLWLEVEASKARELVWGEHDCCLFAARCVDAMTGSEYVRELQAEYQDKTTGLRFIARHGSLQAAIESILGEPVQWWKVKRGDVCLVPSADGLGSLGVCLGPTIACVLERGLQYEPIDRAIVGWRIP
jgi:hypothetical protein